MVDRKSLVYRLNPEDESLYLSKKPGAPCFVTGAISTAPIQEKLRSLSQYMPGQPESTYALAAYLADRLSSELTPEGFNMIAESALSDLRKGVNGITGRPITISLAMNPPIVYELLRKTVPKIAEAVCPQDFARSVREIHEQVKESLSHPPFNNIGDIGAYTYPNYTYPNYINPKNPNK